jgi:hypothetical protein
LGRQGRRLWGRWLGCARSWWAVELIECGEEVAEEALYGPAGLDMILVRRTCIIEVRLKVHLHCVPSHAARTSHRRD